MSFDMFKGTEYAAAVPRCYESHPGITLGNGTLHGGSASWPVVKDADIYVSLQQGSTCGRVSDPWAKQVVTEIQHAIQDGEVPTNLPRFKKMIDWLCNQLQDGKKIHVGCVGGHGRTGMILSAIVAQMLKEKDAIQYVRKHYCKKAVESPKQVKFLMEHYKVSKVDASRDERLRVSSEYIPKVGKTGFGGGSRVEPPWAGRRKAADAMQDRISQLPPDRPSKSIVPAAATQETKTFAPLPSARSIWQRGR